MATRTRRATRTTDNAVLVKVARVGGTVTEYALDGEKTVAAALELADISVGTGARIRVRGRVATLETKLVNGDVVTVAEKVQGGR